MSSSTTSSGARAAMRSVIRSSDSNIWRRASSALASTREASAGAIGVLGADLERPRPSSGSTTSPPGPSSAARSWSESPRTASRSISAKGR